MTQEGIYEDPEGNIYQIIEEIDNPDLKKIYCTYNGMNILNNRWPDYDPNNHSFI